MDHQTIVLTFLSTLPARGATVVLGRMDAMAMISIHAPREGSDPYPISFSA